MIWLGFPLQPIILWLRLSVRIQENSWLCYCQPQTAYLFGFDSIHKITHGNLDNPVYCGAVTMYVHCFTGFFRFDVISRVKRRDFSFHSVHKRKNNQLRRGNEAVVSELFSPACHVSLLKRYLDEFPFPPNSRASFSTHFQREGFCRLVSPDKPFSYCRIRDGFRRGLETLVLTHRSSVFIPSVRVGPPQRLIMALIIVFFSVMAAGSLPT